MLEVVPNTIRSSASLVRQTPVHSRELLCKFSACSLHDIEPTRFEDATAPQHKHLRPARSTLKASPARSALKASPARSTLKVRAAAIQAKPRGNFFGCVLGQQQSLENLLYLANTTKLGRTFVSCT